MFLKINRILYNGGNKMKKIKLPSDIQKDVDDTVKYLGVGCVILFAVLLVLGVIFLGLDLFLN